MTLKVFQYPNCSTCKKALKWLDAQGIAHESVHIVEKPPSKALLSSVLEQGELPIKALFNTSGESYRAGGFKERLPTMSKSEALSELAKDGKLIKRPLAVGDGVVLVGFKEDEWKAALA
jgi:arsenate reductase